MFHVVLACYALLIFSFYFFFKPFYIIMVLNWAFDNPKPLKEFLRSPIKIGQKRERTGARLQEPKSVNSLRWGID
ncbi:hypothetical protein ANCDUO_06784 [Ancylostoma duodenale]|uniref:Uncharacterized protein n=1 Tax=Ancylostoma duodenale TaxID=51022 RepID=A0A0C2D0S3_9BILA|nr:hypothetical protein ANCDUO_06784 [Ancylostoma duodenale]